VFTIRPTILTTQHRKNQPTKAAIAQHCFEQSHKIGNIKLLKEVRRPQQLNVRESLFISRVGEKLVNIENPTTSFSPLFLSAKPKSPDDGTWSPKYVSD
jgi:hypothetical protein